MLTINDFGSKQSKSKNKKTSNKYFVNLALATDIWNNLMFEDQEDTPALAVARYEEVKKLEDMLIQLTQGYIKIQAEPSKALCRFLFSSKLAEDKSHTSDPLLSNLPDDVYYDKSICFELNNNPAYARLVCNQLCTASRQAVSDLNILKTQPSTSEVQLRRDAETWWVSWGDASICIEDGLLSRLQRMYRKTLTMTDNAPLDQNFNRRLFCLLMRYKSLGGQDNMITKGGCFHEASKLFSSDTWSAFRDLEVTKECTASPFNSSAPTFWSAFADTDCFFGSKGNFFDASDTELRKGGSFMADGPPVEETLELLERRIHAILGQNTNPTSFVVGYPPWRNMDCWKNLKNSKYLVFHLDNCTVDHFGHMSLFILQNKNGKKRWSVTPEIRMKLERSLGVIGKH